MRVIERNVQEIGKSLLVTLPKDWTKTLHITKGSRIKLLISDRGNLSIVPEFTAEESLQDVVIPLDSHCQRRFFREYFQGYERIILKITNQTMQDDREKIYPFLKRFMNAQIIEETESKIVVKCFRIDELSIEECLQRIHFLSLNIIDAILQGDTTQNMTELRDTMTRFYYMLVMQIRRFLSEGKFVKENQIPLVKAMDFRMIAEKIQRISEHLLKFEHIDTSLIPFIQEIKAYYRETYVCFSNDAFEKSVPLWKKGTEFSKKLETMKQPFIARKDFFGYENILELLQITRYVKEISMLVR